jgi:hypothetical protein
VFAEDDDFSTQERRPIRRDRGAPGNCFRVGWISPPQDQEPPGLLADSGIDRRPFCWTPSRFAFGNDRAVVEDVLARASALDGVVISGLSLADLESLFVIRALQVLKRQGRLDLAAIVVVKPGSIPFNRLGDRMRSGWPFRSALFVGDAGTVAQLQADGLTALDFAEAARLGLRELLRRRDGDFADMLEDQVLAVQFQPAWLYGGSTVVFGNQTDAMLDRGWFVVRIIVNADAGNGPTMRRLMSKTVEEASVDATAHVDTLACWGATPHSVDEIAADEFQRVQMLRIMQLAVADALMSEVATAARVAIVNYTVHMGLALRASPAARYVLETHDDITRMRLTQWRTLPKSVAFPDFGSLSRHLRLERMAWRAADVCIALSLSDFAKVRRHAARPVFVLPRPYTRVAAIAGPEARWDILIVMNPHHFNLPALDHFLKEVIAADPILKTLRIAIVGRVKDALEQKWKERLPSTHWLGYVRDLDALRDASRLSVCPDMHGTGIAIKTLTTIAARHPMVATPTALRGLPDTILDLIPPAPTAADMQGQIRTLLEDANMMEQRRRAVAAAADLLWPATSHAPALRMVLETGPDRSRFRAAFLAALGPEPQLQNPPADGQRVRFGIGGNDRHYLGRHWLHDEPGGRWSDGTSATVRLPRTWLSATSRLQICFMETAYCQDIELKHDGLVLAGVHLEPGLMSFDLASVAPGDSPAVEFELSCREAFCPKDAGLSDDERVLGMHIRTLEIVQAPRRSAIRTLFSTAVSGALAVSRKLAGTRATVPGS